MSQTAASDGQALQPGDTVRRHRLPTRIWHWVNFAAIAVLLMSGLSIFNAHPRLYWGQYGANYDYAWLEIGSAGQRGYLRVGDAEVPTTGVLGRWTGPDGRLNTRAFPHWATIPGFYSLAVGRLWHFFFAWIFALGWLAFVTISLVNRHASRDLAPRGEQLRPRHVWQDIKDHARLRFPTGAAALDYNILQKLSYLVVIFGLIPLMIATGLTMSPQMDASWSWLLDIFGGRQSARSIHFICAWTIVAFFIVHIVMVLLAGPINEVRSMITGRFRLPGSRREQEEVAA